MLDSYGFAQSQFTGPRISVLVNKQACEKIYIQNGLKLTDVADMRGLRKKQVRCRWIQQKNAYFLNK
jgi:hypothetical protein